MPLDFNFGRHETERDATRRFRDSFASPLSVPGHFVIENVPFTHYRPGMPEAEFVRQAMAKVTPVMRADITDVLGVGIWKLSKSVQAEDPFGTKQLRLALSCNRTNTRVTLHFEPVTEDVLRGYYRWLSSARPSGADSLEAVRAKAENRIGLFVKANVPRMHNLADFLANLHDAHPAEKTLVGLGTNHSYFPELMAKRFADKQIPTSSSTVEQDADRVARNALIHHELRAALNLPTRTDENSDLLWRRFTLAELLDVAGLGADKADVVVHRMTEPQVGELETHLRAAGKNLPAASLAWAKAHTLL